ncbi:MAG: putative urea ABC transporter substrate-binding protein [Pseudomonadota bacterium]|nr:lipid kinase [Alphaproteobacteria bacterium]
MSGIFRKCASLLLAAVMLVAVNAGPASAEQKTSFKVCWSIYVGWMPWGYLQDSGIMKNWAKKYGIDVEIVQINDYVESINQYTAGGFDGCAMTNMDALTIPAVGGVDSTALIAGDFSNGNDGIVVKKGEGVAGLKGQKINLVELSVSHYLLARALEKNGLTEKDVTLVNTSDADIVGAFTGSEEVSAVVTWNPQLSEVAAAPGAVKIFDSSQIPGEIIDLMVVNTQTLADNPAFGKALTGAWYEVMDKMKKDPAIRAEMAKAAGTDAAGFEAQLATTRMMYLPGEGVAFATGAKIKTTMDAVRKFSAAHGLMGAGGTTEDSVGIAFPHGAVLGDPANVKLRFDATYMRLAADGKL